MNEALLGKWFLRLTLEHNSFQFESMFSVQYNQYNSRISQKGSFYYSLKYCPVCCYYSQLSILERMFGMVISPSNNNTVVLSCFLWSFLDYFLKINILVGFKYINNFVKFIFAHYLLASSCHEIYYVDTEFYEIFSSVHIHLDW